MKYIFTLISIFFFNKINALEFSCFFEEVYQDGQVQNGTFVIKNNKTRYQYEDKNLYTIIYAHKTMKVIHNHNKKLLNSNKTQRDLFKNLTNIAGEFPDIKEEYQIEGYNLKFEKYKNDLFLKRISINSDINVNLSVYFYDCKNKEIYDIYFWDNPFFEYEH